MNDLQRLLPDHFKIIDHMVSGHDVKTIAQLMDRTPQSISLLMKSTLIQGEVARRRQGIEKQMDENTAMIPARAKEVLEKMSESAAYTLGGLLGSDSEQTRLKASTAILDRVFGDPSKSVVANVIIERDAINILQIALKEVTDSQPKPSVEIQVLEPKE